MAANSKANLSPVSNIIFALQVILARSQVIIPDLETPYSQASSLNTNYPAIELKDRAVIGAIITERQQELDAVLHEISGLETVMDGINNLRRQLVKKKDKITQSMNSHKRLISTLWRLPTEVLSSIFIYCLPEDKYLPPASGQAPMLLTRICRRWRDVAVDMPSLWCRLSVDVHDGYWQRAAFGCNSWLKRSQQRPLSLALTCVACDTVEQRSLLQPYMNQISSLNIHFPYSYYADVPFMLTNLLTLQDLTIRVSDPQPRLVQWMSRLPPTLRSVKIMGLFDIELLSSLNPVWFHLTDVHMTILRINEVLLLLRLCPNLSSLTTRVAPNRGQALVSFTHTKLQSLRIADNGVFTRPLSDMFNALSLPDLRVFEASNVLPWPHEAFKTLLARSNCPLETLSFGGDVTMTDEQRAEYVALIPSVEVVVDPRVPSWHVLLDSYV
ncbi:hypothetical protein EDB19DRAFT_1683168 [Suillus lakei]|nr:hypothetical protein EDB19DRAFT_1683168 [Suillus lakei]